MTFSASGREDVDVRMLGAGRPFYIKIDNAKERQFSYEQFRDVERQVGLFIVKILAIVMFNGR